MNASQRISKVLEDAQEYGLTDKERLEQFEAINEDREVYELEVVDNILDALRDANGEDVLEIDLWEVPDWPREQLDHLVISIKESFIKKLQINGLIRSYDMKVITHQKEEENYFPHERASSSIKVSSLSTLHRYLTQTKKGIEDKYKILFKLKYTKDRKIILNDRYQLAHPNLESENDRFFSYIINKANKKISIRFLRERLGLKKNIHNTLNDLGFSHELKAVFFSAGKTTVEFRGNITEDDLKKLKTDTARLWRQIDELPQEVTKKE